tara:strand:+ start:63 stop:2120 length:2058 start_codon:yes stop_codon:yes gene_type:complete
MIIYIFLITFGSLYWYLSSPLGLEGFNFNKKKKKLKKKVKASKKLSKKNRTSNQNEDNTEKLSMQRSVRVYFENFNKALRNNTYDIDNIVDNGLLPDDSYLDGKEDRYTKFQMLGNIFMDPNNVESIVIADTNRESYLLKGYSVVDKMFFGKKGSSDVTIDDYVIGVVDEDEGVNKYLNFEFFYRVFGSIIYDRLDIDDDESRENYHNRWLDLKMTFFPNGVVKTAPAKMTNVFISKDKGLFDSLKVFFEEVKNPHTKKANKMREAMGRGNDTKPGLADFNSKKMKEYTQLFQSDITERISKLVGICIFGISLIVLPMMKFPNTKEEFKKACKMEFKCKVSNSDEGEKTPKQNTNDGFMHKLLFMNQSEPLRWIKAVPILPVYFGVMFIACARFFLTLKLSKEWGDIGGIFFAILCSIYVLYQIFLLMPTHHEMLIGCCINRRLWGGESENLTSVIAFFLTIIATPLFVLFYVTVSGNYPFFILLYSLYKDDASLFDSEESKKYAVNFFKKALFITVVIICSEVISCIAEYYHGIDNVNLYNNFLVKFVLPPILIMWIFIQFMRKVPNELKPKVEPGDVECVRGRCRIEDETEMSRALMTKAQLLWKGTLLPVAAAADAAFDSDKDKALKEFDTRKYIVNANNEALHKAINQFNNTSSTNALQNMRAIRDIQNTQNTQKPSDNNT